MVTWSFDGKRHFTFEEMGSQKKERALQEGRSTRNENVDRNAKGALQIGIGILWSNRAHRVNDAVNGPQSHIPQGPASDMFGLGAAFLGLLPWGPGPADPTSATPGPQVLLSPASGQR